MSPRTLAFSIPSAKPFAIESIDVAQVLQALSDRPFAGSRRPIQLFVTQVVAQLVEIFGDHFQLVSIFIEGRAQTLGLGIRITHSLNLAAIVSQEQIQSGFQTWKVGRPAICTIKGSRSRAHALLGRKALDQALHLVESQAGANIQYDLFYRAHLASPGRAPAGYRSLQPGGLPLCLRLRAVRRSAPAAVKVTASTGWPS